ncbi:hypothetical protein EVAR_24279_1 [Eumeta japonica]|uniref:Uncharacterized protein n=1 Tax=Eumeta variegata TaxID=151549 RepID=A0A4C1VFT7_EUMVA|nr:hypothetical protein EVAR_24279_1 [Eumeta japonica]
MEIFGTQIGRNTYWYAEEYDERRITRAERSTSEASKKGKGFPQVTKNWQKMMRMKPLQGYCMVRAYQKFLKKQERANDNPESYFMIMLAVKRQSKQLGFRRSKDRFDSGLKEVFTKMALADETITDGLAKVGGLKVSELKTGKSK